MGSLAAASLRPLRDGATEAMLDSQLFQGLLADALDSEQVQIALRKALETDGAEHVVQTLFESGLIDEFVDRLVADGAVWVLINAVLASDEAEQLVANGALWGLIDKALQSDGADALVAGPALWSLINQALESDRGAQLVESGALWALISRALASDRAQQLVADEAFWSLINRALQTDGAAHLVESGALWELIDQALQSEGAERLVTNPVLWKLITRALEGSGADALVNSPALWSLIEAAIASDGAARLIHSPALWTLIDEALERDQAHRLVAKLFDSGLADQFVERLLTSNAVWRLVDEIAASPAVTAAVTQQSLGFADQVGGEVRARARQADDWLLHKARRDKNGVGPSASANGFAPPAPAQRQEPSPSAPPQVGPSPAVPPAPQSGTDADALAVPLTGDDLIIPAGTTPRAEAVEPELRYIGIVARTVAFTVDAGLIMGAAFIVQFGIALIVAVAHPPSSWKSAMVVVGAIAFAFWAMVYFVVFWTTTGQTPGARLMQFRVVPTKGDKLKPRRAAVRAIGLVLAAIPLFAGYLPVAFGRKRRGLQDYVARTIVVDAPQLSIAEAKRVVAHADRIHTGIASSPIQSGDAMDPLDGQPGDEREQLTLNSAGENGDAGGFSH